MAHTDHLKYGAILYLSMIAIMGFTHLAITVMPSTTTSHITSKE